MTPRLTIDAHTYLGETPTWAADEGALYWINCEQPPMLSRWIAASGERRDWPMPERIGGFVLKAGGGALVVLSHGLHDFDLDSGALTLRVASPLPEHISLHECACDRQGRLWVGSFDHRLRDYPELPGNGFLYRLDGDRLIPQADGINCANGLAFSPDGSTLYLSDSPKRTVEQWTVDANGDLSDRRPFVTLEEGAGFVDGATVDAAGDYWAALVYGAAIRRWRADGSVVQTIALPFASPTKLAFGGNDLATVFVTTCKLTGRPGAEVGAAWHGGVYSFGAGVAGLPEPRLRDRRFTLGQSGSVSPVP